MMTKSDKRQNCRFCCDDRSRSIRNGSLLIIGLAVNVVDSNYIFVDTSCLNVASQSIAPTSTLSMGHEIKKSQQITDTVRNTQDTDAIQDDASTKKDFT